jgi:3-methyladenine DNA glycosylase AlkD
LADIRGIEQRLSKVQHGFKEMKQEAGKAGTLPVPVRLQLARQLYGSDRYQTRMVAVFILGFLAYESREALAMMRTRVSKDESWQVQEILAQAFDSYCKAAGYEASLPTIRSWLADKNPNVRRAVTEGLRIWTQRAYFKEHPEVAISLLCGLRADESEYVRRSVGNALRDISRKHKDLVRAELAAWDSRETRTKLTYGLASKFL